MDDAAEAFEHARKGLQEIEAELPEVIVEEVCLN